MVVNSISCLLLGLGLSTNGQFVELTRPMTYGQVGISHRTYESFGEKYDDTGMVGRLTLLTIGHKAKVMAGLTLDVEHHLQSAHYNETYITSTPSLSFLAQPSFSKEVILLFGTELGRGFYTLKGDLVEKRTAFEAKYNFTVGLYFKIR